MSKNNRPFKVLPTSGDSGLLSAGQALSTLSPGQLGIFDANTNLSIAAIGNQKVYLALGVDTNGDGSLNDIVKSAGFYLTKAQVKAISAACYTTPVPMVFQVDDFNADCDTEYGIKIEFRSQEIYRTHGYNQAAKTYLIKTSCCEKCTECNSGSCVEVAKRLADNINADEEKLLTASLIGFKGSLEVATGASAAGDITIGIGSTNVTVTVANGDTTSEVAAKINTAINAAEITGVVAVVDGDIVTVYNTSAVALSFTDTGSTSVAVTDVDVAKTVITDTETFKLENPNGCLKLEVATNLSSIRDFCGINAKYFNPRELVVIPTLISGFDCNGKITVTQDVVFGQGSGYDVKQLEYTAGGWNGNPGPYRQSALHGLPKDIDYLTSGSTNYNLFNVSYDLNSVGGFQEFDNHLETIIAIPCSDTTTYTAIKTVFDNLVSTVPDAQIEVDTCNACNGVA